MNFLTQKSDKPQREEGRDRKEEGRRRSEGIK
jgi:hypothetical protein